MKKFLIILLAAIIIFSAVIIINGVYCENTLEIVNYQIKSDKIKTDLHFVVVSDQHNKEFGKGNSKLIEKIRAENPDFICVCGDMICRGNTDTHVMEEFLTEISKTSPVFCVLGNHELDSAELIDFKKLYSSTGAVLLDNDYIEFEKNGEKIRIGGVNDYPYYEKYAPNFNNSDAVFWEDFEKNSDKNYTILLHHQPEYIGDLLYDSNIDLVLCGHTHGGLVRIPFIGGLIAPNQGLFPKYDKGEFEFGKTKMIIGSGLSSGNGLFFRVNNCAEITVIDINR